MLKQENILIDAGLSEEQALAYQTLVERGPMRASALSGWLGIKRGLTYKVLEQLEAMGLVSKKGGEGTVATFTPEHPSRLMDLVEQKAKSLALTRETLAYSLGTLASQFNLQSGKPNVQFYEGEEAIKKITSDLPTTDKEILQCIDISKAIAYFKDDTLGYIKKRTAKNISKKMLIPMNAENKAYIQNASPMTEFRFMENSELPTSIQIYDARVTILTLSPEKQVGLIIDDALIAQTFKTLFAQLWAGATPSSSQS